MLLKLSAVKCSTIFNRELNNKMIHLLGQIVIDDKCVFAIVSEVFSHGAARIGSQVLQRSRIRCCSRYHNGVFHGVGISQPLHQLSYCGSLLADSNIDAIQLFLLISSIVEALLIDDCVDSNGSFAAKQI